MALKDKRQKRFRQRRDLVPEQHSSKSQESASSQREEGRACPVFLSAGAASTDNPNVAAFLYQVKNHDVL